MIFHYLYLFVLPSICFYLLLLAPTYLFLLASTGFYFFSPNFSLSQLMLTYFYMLLLVFTFFYLFLHVFTRFYPFLPLFTRCYLFLYISTIFSTSNTSITLIQSLNKNHQNTVNEPRSSTRDCQTKNCDISARRFPREGIWS